ncbi:MAG: hypothetical protein FWG70_03590 [Oscillospiraceae bacterium]|nr:hypothetical protein [Oscillospiraceae bacterium]
MNKYVIKSISSPDGTPKGDRKNIQRVGSMITMLEAVVSRPLGYAYITDKNGDLKEGSFTGGVVKRIRKDENAADIEIVTPDSVFKFTLAGEYDNNNEYVNRLLADSDDESGLKASITRTGVDDVTCIDLDTLLKEI